VLENQPLDGFCVAEADFENEVQVGQCDQFALVVELLLDNVNFSLLCNALDGILNPDDTDDLRKALYGAFSDFITDQGCTVTVAVQTKIADALIVAIFDEYNPANIAKNLCNALEGLIAGALLLTVYGGVEVCPANP
jgi:hypothetical protein